MKPKRTRKTGKTNGHDHVVILDVRNNGKTIKSNRDHVHKVNNGVVLEAKEHIHKLKI